MKNKKYELLKDDTIVINGRVLHRIRALKNFGNAHTGDLGGYIEKEENLSHSGDCWVYDNAKVFGNAQIFDRGAIAGKAIVYGNSMIFGRAGVFDMAKVFGDARIHGNTKIFSNAKIFDSATVSGMTEIYGNARVFGNANVSGKAEIHEKARIFGNAKVSGNTEICGNTSIFGNANVSDDGYLFIFGNVKISGNASVSGNINISGDADIRSNDDYFSCNNVGSRNDTVTFYRTIDNNIMVTTGCFTGTLEEFRRKVKETHGDNKYAKEYMLLSELACVHIKEKHTNYCIDLKIRE